MKGGDGDGPEGFFRRPRDGSTKKTRNFKIGGFQEGSTGTIYIDEVKITNRENKFCQEQGSFPGDLEANHDWNAQTICVEEKECTGNLKPIHSCRCTEGVACRNTDVSP